MYKINCFIFWVAFVLFVVDTSYLWVYLFLMSGFWGLTLMLGASLIRYLLVLEILTSVSLLIASRAASGGPHGLAILYVIVVLSVGEACLGLSLLAQATRLTSDKVASFSIS